MRFITNEDFYKEFIECLKERKPFELENCIVDGNVDILKIYERIKDDEDLKKLVEEKDDGIYVKIDISICIRNIEFRSHVNFYTGAYSKGTIQEYDYNGELIFLKLFEFINCRVIGEFTAMNCVFEKYANFSGSIFDGKVDFRNSKFEGNAGFNKCIFNEYVKINDMRFSNLIDTDFSGVVFGDLCFFEKAEFYGETKFSTILIKVENNLERRQTEFLEEVSFKKAKFFGEVKFHAIFGKEEDNNAFKNVDFKEAEFHNKVSFDDSEFNTRVFFEECKFKGETYFQSMVFRNIVGFDKSIFDEHVKFDCIFETLVSFKETEFNHSVNFTHTKFNTNIEKITEMFRENIDNLYIMDFRLTKFKNALFKDSEFNTNVLFYGAEFEYIYFHKVKFKKSISFEFCKCKGYFRFFKNYSNHENENGELVFKGDLYIKYCSFDGVVVFKEVEFRRNIEIIGCEFKKDVLFSESKFERESNFSYSKFEGEMKFSDSRFNIVKFEKTIFKSITKFSDISFNLLSFVECTFEDIVVFKKKEENKDIGIAIFNLVNFKKPENTTFIDFPLSKTSFLLTDVKDITIITKAEKILSEYLLEYLEKKNNGEINDNNRNELYERTIKILKPYLRQETVLKEYRDIRKSFEKNRTFVEASELFIYEMDLIRRITTFDERKIIGIIKKYMPTLRDNLYYVYIYLPHLLLLGLCWVYFKSYSVIFLVVVILFIIIYILHYSKINTTVSKLIVWITFWIYKITSNYGESMTKPIIISIIVILAIPYIIKYLYIWNPLDDKLLEQTLRAFFQLKMNVSNDAPKELQTLASYEWLIRVISLILLGSLFIAIKRRLERK